MGLSRLIYRIFKMVFRDFLFKIPKKYLVVIIVFLTIFILKSNVFAYSNYDMIPTDSPAVDCVYYDYVTFDSNNDYLDLHLESNPVYNSEGLDANYWFSIDFKANDRYNSFNLFNINSQDFRLYHDYSGAFAGIRFNWGGYENDLVNLQNAQWGTNLELDTNIIFRLMTASSGQTSTFVVTQGETLINSGSLTLGEDYYNADGSLDLIIGPNCRSADIKNFKVGISNTDDSYRVGLVNGYPCKYLDSSGATLQYIEGYYDIVTGCFIVYDGFYFNDNNIMSEPPQEIQDYTPSVPSPSPTPDIHTGLSNIDNSINNMNSFFQNDTMDNTLIDINSPSVSNTQVSNSVDNGLTSFFSIFTNGFDSSTTKSIDIYIPNYITGGGTKFITINSNIVRNALSNTAVIPGANVTILNLIELVWSALFGYWFIVIITGLVNMIYSGSLMSDSSLQKLSSTYTGVTGSML